MFVELGGCIREQPPKNNPSCSTKPKQTQWRASKTSSLRGFDGGLIEFQKRQERVANVKDASAPLRTKQ